MIISLTLVLSACGANNIQSPVKTPGANNDVTPGVLEAGSDPLQSKSHLKSINIHPDDFHFYTGDINIQIESHYYASLVNENVHQAIIHDDNGEDTSIMGIEYFTSDRLFRQSREEEKKLWHSYQYEVKSGTRSAPGVTERAEHKQMEKQPDTYGKTIHTWHTDKDKNLPMGALQIMTGFTKDGQINEQVVARRDIHFTIASAEKKKNRADILPVAPGANFPEQGTYASLRYQKYRAIPQCTIKPNIYGTG